MSKVEEVNQLVEKYHTLKKEISKVIVGQEDVIDQVLISIFSRGHCLLVGVPGLAKTLLVNTIAQTLGLSFNRIQFTPDLMPSDIIGSEILDENKQFKFVKGPLFHNIILADEINRTPPKTQSALLEAMQEKSVTAAGKTYPLPQPFSFWLRKTLLNKKGLIPYQKLNLTASCLIFGLIILLLKKNLLSLRPQQWINKLRFHRFLRQRKYCVFKL